MRSTYDPAVAQLILDRMSEGEGMDAICADNQMPPRRVVRRWLVTVPEFRAQYDVARELQGESISDEIIAIERKVLTGELTASAANVAIQSMQWRMSRLAPKRWGTKVAVDHRTPSDVRRMTDDELANLIATGMADGSEGGTVPPPRSRLSH